MAKPKKTNGLVGSPVQPVLPVPPVQPLCYRLKVPKNAERLFGSLHLVPSSEPLNVF
jgi:hypothetical protein